MKAIETTGTVEEDRCVRLDAPLPHGVSGRVRLIILVAEDELGEDDWLRAAARGGAFDFLDSAGEDLYTLEDGKPLDDTR